MSITIAITGGPSGGKTTLLQILQKEFGTSLALVPEAASILYRGGFPRTGLPLNRRHVQRAICFVQRELEDLAREELLAIKRAESATAAAKALVICDRGTLDSIAYWPASEEDFFSSLGTTRDQELARYDWIIHLDTAPEEDFDTLNPIRTENFEEAMQLNTHIHTAWRGHPQLLVIPNNEDFLDKMSKARKAVTLIQQGKSLAFIKTELFPTDEDLSG